MGMQNPEVSEPLDKFSDKIGEGVPFYLTGIRTVKAKAKDYGEGEMVVLKVQGQERELGIWGAYLLAQAKAVDQSDLNRWYVVKREVIEGFGGGNASKVLRPVEGPVQQQAPIDDAAFTGGQAA